MVGQLLAACPTQVRFAVKHYPLPMHKESPLADEAAAAARDQGKFWEVHDLLFQTQSKLMRRSCGQSRAIQPGHPQIHPRPGHPPLQTHGRVRPPGRQPPGRGRPPHFFINGQAISGGVGLADFKHLIDAALNETPHQPQQSFPPGGEETRLLPGVADSRSPEPWLTTNPHDACGRPAQT